MAEARRVWTEGDTLVNGVPKPLDPQTLVNRVGDSLQALEELITSGGENLSLEGSRGFGFLLASLQGDLYKLRFGDGEAQLRDCG